VFEIGFILSRLILHYDLQFVNIKMKILCKTEEKSKESSEYNKTHAQRLIGSLQFVNLIQDTKYVKMSSPNDQKG
jgi:hypothetical protein